MRPSNLGPVRPVLEEEPSRRPRSQALVAVALGFGVLIVVLLLLGRDRSVEETTVATSVPATSTMAVTTTSATTTTTEATATTSPAASGLFALASFRAGPLPPEATCPPGSTPNTPGDPSAPRPSLGLDPFRGGVSAAFDRESGLLVLVVEETGASPERGLTTWTFDPCRNQWGQMASAGLAPAYSRLDITYDADSDRMVGIDGAGVVWAYDTNTDTWTSIPWTLDRPALPVDWTTLYHDRSGLLLLYRFPGEALWAYDIDTDSRYQLGLWDPPAGVLLHNPAAPDGSMVFGVPWPDFYVFHFFEGPASTSWWYIWRWEQLPVTTPSCPCVEFGDLFTGTLAFDEATGRALAFCGTALFATFDPIAQEWQVAQGFQDGPPGPFWGNPVYDSANDRLIFVGPNMWAFDGSTQAWIELLPAQ